MVIREYFTKSLHVADLFQLTAETAYGDEGQPGTRTAPIAIITMGGGHGQVPDLIDAPVPS